MVTEERTYFGIDSAIARAEREAEASLAQVNQALTRKVEADERQKRTIASSIAAPSSKNQWLRSPDVAAKDAVRNCATPRHPGSIAPVTLREPLPTEPPMDQLDGAFYARVAQVGERIFTCSSGIRYAYFTEGDPADPTVLCIHGMCQNKYLWLEPEAIEGVFLIAIDRVGHGSSSAAPVNYGFDKAVRDVIELLDARGIKQLYLVGHSAGGTWAMNLAAALRERALGVALLASPFDYFHQSFSDEMRAMVFPPQMLQFAATIQAGGCKAALLRCAAAVLFSRTSVKRQGEDFGLAAEYASTPRKGEGGDDVSFAEMDRDHFFVTKTLLSYYGLQGGFIGASGFVSDIERQAVRWAYDPACITCRTFVYTGDLDATIRPRASRFIQRTIPGAELVIFPHHGHATILLETPRVIRALVEGQSVDSRYAVDDGATAAQFVKGIFFDAELYESV